MSSDKKYHKDPNNKFNLEDCEKFRINFRNPKTQRILKDKKRIEYLIKTCDELSGKKPDSIIKISDLVEKQDVKKIKQFLIDNNNKIFNNFIYTKWFVSKFLIKSKTLGEGTYGTVICPPKLIHNDAMSSFKIINNKINPQYCQKCNEYSLEKYVGKIFDKTNAGEAKMEFKEATKIHKLCKELTVNVYDLAILQDKKIQIIYENGGNVINSENKHLKIIKTHFDESFINFVMLFKKTLVNNQYLHLDIKPDNILWNPEKNKLLLIDFGLSSSIKNVDVFIKNNVNLIGQKYMFWCPDFYIVNKLSKQCQLMKPVSKKYIEDILLNYSAFLTSSLKDYYGFYYIFDITDDIINYYYDKYVDIQKHPTMVKYNLNETVTASIIYFIYKFFLEGTLITSDLFSLALYYLIINKTIIKSNLPVYIDNFLTFHPHKRLEYMRNFENTNKIGGSIISHTNLKNHKINTTNLKFPKISISKEDRKILSDARIKALDNLLK